MANCRGAVWVVFWAIFASIPMSFMSQGKLDNQHNSLNKNHYVASMSVSGVPDVLRPSMEAESRLQTKIPPREEGNIEMEGEATDLEKMFEDNENEEANHVSVNKNNKMHSQKAIGNNLSGNKSSPILPDIKPLLTGQKKLNKDEKVINKEANSEHLKSTQDIKTRQTANDIKEKSKSLIQRLCDVSSHSKRHLCYQQGSSNCYCRGGLADCSGKPHVPNVSYAPKLPVNIKCLSLANNNIRGLDDSFFTNVSMFVAIDISSNKLARISSQTFAGLTNLKYLILNDNSLDYANLRAVFNYPPSLRIDLIGLDLQQVPENYFQNHSHIATSQIYMDRNYMPVLDLREFAKLNKLEYLSLTDCSIQRVISAPLCNLKVLYLNNNKISSFPPTCSNQISLHDPGNDANYACVGPRQMLPSRKRRAQNFERMDEESVEYMSLFPSLRELYIGNNVLLSLPPKEQLCIPKITILYLPSNNITEISGGVLTFLHSLIVLHLDKMNTGIMNIGPAAFNSSSLTSLYMSKNKVQFDSKNVSTQLFQGCDRLHTLSIDHNNLHDMTADLFEDMFRHTPALRYVYMSSTQMQIIPIKAFSSLKKLEKLFIYVNAIKEIPPGAFDNMPALRCLYMDENMISTVQESAFSTETRLRLQEINLSRNQYLCDCNLIWFRNWLQQAGSTQFLDTNNYFCSNIPNMSVQHYTISKQACLFSREDYILFTICLSILVVVFVVFAVVYRYRWNIRLMMYERRAPRRNINGQADEVDFRYDVFVVYNNDDSKWVMKLLLPVLEKRWGLKTCIHQRDFVAGSFIIDNIVESMNASRRILVVASSRFSRSNWCNFELQLCQSHIITHDLPSLIVIVLDEIEARDMGAAMLALYNTTCCLEWPWESRESHTFWARLKKTLAAVIKLRPQATSSSKAA